ncbi:MAG: acyloxyacyl hydrolase [Bacteroidota bacterium]
MAGNGIQYIGQLIGNNNHNIALKTTYYYQVNFYQLQYYQSILRHRTFGIEILAQPQYNTTKYKKYRDADQTEYLNGFETGLNLGFLFRKNVSNNQVSFYMLISSGPHYISDTPVRQSNGFVFSNNFCAGVNLKIYKGLYADIRTGIRHMSNAGFKIPNAGINDMTLNEGFMVVF